MTYEIEEPDEPLPASGYRTYEVFQRERVGESTHLLSPRELAGPEMLTDPYRLLTILREEYPCYRDWTGNRFWVTRYDDVTSIFTDDANFATRSKRDALGGGDVDVEQRFGRSLWEHVPVLDSRAARIDRSIDATLDRVIAGVVERLERDGTADVAIDVAARLPLELWGDVLELEPEDLDGFSRRYWRLQLGAGWEPQRRVDAMAAHDELVDFFEPMVAERRGSTGDGSDDLVSTIASLEPGGDPATARDVVATILEADHQTLHGGLSNLWLHLLTHPERRDRLAEEPRLMTSAWRETLRHSPPVHHAHRYARHEVERFGRLLPEGAMLHLSAAAANRDPRVFDDPDRFVLDRKDLCQREPRGQYRADGLPSGIAFGLGPPSIHPAVPKERPRSIYAITRDVAVRASRRLVAELPTLRLVDGAEPTIRALHLGAMHTCWQLPVTI